MAPLGTAHKFNHENQHEVCDIYGSPHRQYIGDGHTTHTHDPDSDKAKAMHDHDPCKQTRMDYPGYEPVAPVKEVSPPTQELPPEEVIFDDNDPTNSEVYTGGEAYQFPIPSGSFKKIENLVISSDAQAASLAADGVLSGNGTKGNPYVVENFIANNSIVIRDTSACFVVKNNIIVDRAVEAPIPPPPETEIINVTELIQYLLDRIEELLDIISYYVNLTAEWDALKQVWDENFTIWDTNKVVWDVEKAVWESDKTSLDDRLAEYQAEYLQWQQTLSSYEGDYLDAVLDTEQLADNFEFYVESVLGYDPTTVTPPPTDHQQFISGGSVTDMASLQAAFEAYQDDASQILAGLDPDGIDPAETVYDVRDMIDGNPPGASPPPGYSGSPSQWSVDAAQYDDYRQWIKDQISAYWETLEPATPNYTAYNAFMAEYAAFQAEYDAFMADYNAFMADYNTFLTDFNAFMADYDTFLADYTAIVGEADQVIADAQEDIDRARATLKEVSGFLWKVGRHLFNTTVELLDYLLELILGILNPEDPNEVANNNGQLVLDWNGQCLHVYNNVINDLRVNQNNDRTGEATGGIIEANRIFTIGQIRHYDGIFRNNEVGNRAHLYSLVDENISAPGGDRSVNNDGANQGWYYDNVFYGQIDLDFHGHHHSPGFFAVESHYHGSTYSVAYMVNSNGGCAFTHDDVMGHNHMHHKDNDFQVLGQTIIDGPDEQTCLPHHDHSKRWTSVFFNDNVVVDPNGVGLRFEDENHRADDEQANSENMRELKGPHFHQKWIQMENNSIVGKIFIDVLNAKGTYLWSDDWSEVENTEGVERTIEALDHPGARIIYSHPMRNDAWVDIKNNTLLQTQGVGVLVSDAEFMTRLDVRDNRALGLPNGIHDTKTFEQLRDWLKASRTASFSSLKTDVNAWPGSDRGTQTFAIVRDAIDDFEVVFCGNQFARLDKSLVATDRIYDDGQSTIDHACTPQDDEDPYHQNVLGGAAAPAVSWIPAPPDRVRFSDPLRTLTADTDSFYILELGYDVADALLPPVPVEV